MSLTIDTYLVTPQNIEEIYERVKTMLTGHTYSRINTYPDEGNTQVKEGLKASMSLYKEESSIIIADDGVWGITARYQELKPATFVEWVGQKLFGDNPDRRYTTVITFLNKYSFIVDYLAPNGNSCCVLVTVTDL